MVAWEELEQAVVVHPPFQVPHHHRPPFGVGVEAAEGTDALIERCGPLLSSAEGGVLVKACRPRQDLRIDLPAIGPRTVANAARVGLAGIAIEAGRALVLDAEAVARDADSAGLFVIGVDRPG